MPGQHSKENPDGVELPATAIDEACGARALSDSITPSLIARALLSVRTPSFNPKEFRLDTRLKLVRRIGVGSMGVVYEAESEQPKRQVAVKLLRPEFATPESIRRFRFEAEVLARLDHPNIARVLGFGVADSDWGESPYLVTELVVGASPITTYATARHLSHKARLLLCESLFAAVANAHEKGIIHRDLKPSNVLVSQDGNVKVIDFGLAKIADASLASEATPTDRTGWIGTPNYLGPEVLTGSLTDADTRSDVYSLGILALEILNGRHPYASLSNDLYRHAMSATSGLISKQIALQRSLLERPLGRIIAGATAMEPSRRYASASVLLETYRAWLGGGRVPLQVPHWVEHCLATLHRHRGEIIATSAVVVAASVALLAALLWQHSQRVESDLGLSRHITSIGAASRAFNHGETGFLASALEDECVDQRRLESRLIESQSKAALPTARLASPATTLRILPCGELVAAGDRLGVVTVLSVDALAPVWRYEIGSPIRDIDVTSCGSHLVASTSGETVVVVDLRDPRLSRSLLGQQAAAAATGPMIALAAPDRIVVVTPTGATIASRPFPSSVVRSLHWSPFDSSLAGVLRERECVWIPLGDPDGLPLAFFQRFGAISSVRWLHDATSRVALVLGNGPMVWQDGKTRPPNSSLRPGGAEVIATSPGRRLLAVGTGLGRVTVADYEQGPPLLDVVAHRGTVTALEISPDGRRVVSAGADGFVRLWDLDPAAEAARREPLVPLGVRSRVGHVAERHPFVTLAAEDGRVATIDVLDRREIFAWNAPDRDPTAVGGSPEQRRFAVGFASGEVWYADRDRCAPFLLAAEPGQVCAVEWLDEQRVAVLWETGTLALLDASEGRRLWQREFGAAGLRVSLAARRILRCGPDEIAVLVASDALDAVRCSISTGTLLGRMHGRAEGLVADRASGMALDADGTTLSIFTSSGDAYRWPRRGPASPQIVDPAPPPIALATATPDPQRLALLSRTGMLTLIDPRDGRSITTLSSVLRPIAAAGFTSHRESLVVVGLDGMARVLPTRAIDAPSSPQFLSARGRED